MSDTSDTEPQVVFYQLSSKFVDTEKDVPDEAQEVMYYTLAVGHHTGVIDCFTEKLRCPLSLYRDIVALFPEGGDARYKLEGILRSGEIQVDQSHLPILKPAVDSVLAELDKDSGSAKGAGSAAHEGEREWLEGFANALETLMHEPAAYIMGRERDS